MFRCIFVVYHIQNGSIRRVLAAEEDAWKALNNNLPDNFFKSLRKCCESIPPERAIQGRFVEVVFYYSDGSGSEGKTIQRAPATEYTDSGGCITRTDPTRILFAPSFIMKVNDKDLYDCRVV